MDAPLLPVVCADMDSPRWRLTGRMLLLALVAWAVRKPMETEAREIRRLAAYDCTAPQNVTAATVSDTPPCDITSTLNIGNRRMVLLQKAKAYRIPAHRCVVKRSTLGFYCGVFDHQTFTPSFSSIMRPAPPAGDECKRAAWSGTHTVQTSRGPRSFKVAMNETTYYYYDRHGQTGFLYGTWHADCVGANLRTEDGTYGYLTVSVNEEFALAGVELAIDQEGGLYDLTNGQSLGKDCQADQGQCTVGGSVTYSWEPPKEEEICFHYATRIVDGQWIPGPGGPGAGELFSQAEMVSLKTKAPVSVCGGHVIWSTDFTDIFVADDSPDQPLPAILRRPLPPGELNLLAYVNQQDRFVWEMVGGTLQDFYLKIQQEQCREAKARLDRRDGVRMSRHASAVDGHVTHIGRGEFLQRSGEVHYHYACPALIVVARDTPGECFDLMPVELTWDDAVRWFRFRGIEDEEVIEASRKSFFLEPRTRLLRREAIRRPCAPTFRPIYMNLDGAWLEATDRVTEVSAPRQLTLGMADRLTAHPTFPDLPFEDGGIYTRETVRNNDELAAIRYKGTILGTKLARQVGEVELMGEEPLGAGSLFAEFPSPTEWLLGAAWRLFQQWGAVVSGVIGVYVLFQFLKGLICNCAIAQQEGDDVSYHRASLGRRATRWPRAILGGRRIQHRRLVKLRRQVQRQDSHIRRLEELVRRQRPATPDRSLGNATSAGEESPYLDLVRPPPYEGPRTSTPRKPPRRGTPSSSVGTGTTEIGGGKPPGKKGKSFLNRLKRKAPSQVCGQYTHGAVVPHIQACGEYTHGVVVPRIGEDGGQYEDVAPTWPVPPPPSRVSREDPEDEERPPSLGEEVRVLIHATGGPLEDRERNRSIEEAEVPLLQQRPGVPPVRPEEGGTGTPLLPVPAPRARKDGQAAIGNGHVRSHGDGEDRG